MRIARLAKLRAMSAPEIIARVMYAGYVTCERQAHRRGRLARPDRVRRGLLRAIASETNWSSATRSVLSRVQFFPGVTSRAHTRDAFMGRYATELRDARDKADSVTRSEVSFFGERFTLGPDIDWHADPVSGARWPRDYHRDVLVDHGNVGYGDVKYVWEVNRHQFFVDLAKVAFLDESEFHALALHRLLRDWMEKVPYATGAPWACALEPAFRVWSWLWAYHMVQAAGMVGDDEHVLWLTGFFDHGRFLHRHLERYSSPYNHLVGEASALFALGVLFPCFEEATAWAERGRSVLESTLESQFHSDGGSVEQSTFYHHATLGFYLLAAILARRNQVDLASTVWSAVERGIGFSAALVQPNGRLPRIGGADDGKPIRLEHLPLWDFRPYQAIGAVLFSRPDFKFVAGRFWEDALWLLGPEGMEAFDRLEARRPPTSAALPASGYYVVRSDWAENADYLCFDCGPQAAGLRRDDVPSAAHGHADCLSLVVALGGREVLVDPGFFCYNGDPEWEVHFRRTAAHNTISVAGRDQAEHVSKMAWTRTFAALAEGWSPTEGWVRGSHDGYRRIAGGVTHRRTAWLRPGGYVIIRDELAGPPGCEARAFFQFAPGELIVNDSAAVYDERYELSWICSSPVQHRVSCGGEGPSNGWIAPSLGVRHPAPRLELLFTIGSSPVVLLTILSDTARRASARQRQETVVSLDGRTLTAHVAFDGYVDEVVAALNEGNGPRVTVRRLQDQEGERQRQQPAAAQ